MSTALFTIPLKQGKTKAYKVLINECLTSKQNDYKDMHVRYGLKATKIWVHTVNGRDYPMFIHDMSDDAEKRLENCASSTYPFDQWFNKNLCACYDIEDMNNLPPQPAFLGELETSDQKWTCH